MIKEVNRACEKMNEALGVSVKLPNPGKRSLNAAGICNFVVGTGLTAAGIVFSSKWCTVLGGIGILSSFILHRENGGEGK
ncbi:MAG: hypothetical protein HFE44_01310 [Oscillospiraceae bacterium]|nr:hypothetical protein [Oscillospiraceae bacterium]